uniref:Chromodomain-helicase-DNA-binding protein 4 n=1 Tax=Cajanus cajan TaxID=3821 RepID=A0A151T441_CAJCA|nr:Chromodomain-helicase-DNA-binding protein 4 [Cajanus cajan]
MESGVRSSGSGVLVESRNSSGCLIVRKKGDGLGATASTSRKLYESKKRANINVSLSDSGSSDELMMPPGRRVGPETIRVCNGLAASERGSSEISRKRNRVELIRGSGEGIASERGLEQRDRKLTKLDVYDFDEYDGMDMENMRRRHLDGNGVGHGGGKFMGSVHASRIGVDREFKTGSSGRVLDKRKDSHYDRPSGLWMSEENATRWMSEENASRWKSEENAKKLKTEETAKKNVPICSSSYLEAKPVEKPRLLKRLEKKRIASRKSLSSKDSKGDEGDSDNIKEGKIKRGSGTEKQKLRERIREMLLSSGWTIDYRPRRNRDYLDAVYINPSGTAYWSIIKAYDALQKQLNDDANEAMRKGDKKSSFGCDPYIHGRKSKKHGRCTLLVRSSDKGLNSEADGFVPYMGKRTVLSWLIDSGSVELSQKVQYRRRKKVLLEGWITRDGIHCGCCSKILTVSKFELHAGSKLPQPYQNIYLESGVSLLQCQIDAWNRQEHSEKIGFHSVDIDGDDPNDDTCGICGDGGDLICCDGCPSTFHQRCLDIQMLPPGEWHCPNCTCKFCGIASGTSDKDEATVYVLRTCNLCEKKYHDSCTKEIDTLPDNFNTSSLSFCGKECKELSEHLKKYLGAKHELEAGFSWSLIHRTDDDSEAACRGITHRVECNSKLAIALTVMDECFLPVIDRRSGINLIRNVLYNCGSNFSRLSYSGFYTAILERGDEIVAAASIRFHGTMIAEMPFIGTRHIYRRQGMCRRLFSAIESALCSLKVEKLVIPAIAELTHTWTTIFGFTHLDESLRQEMKSLNMMAFPGIDMLQKAIVEQRKHEGSEKMENGGNDLTKTGNRSDLGSSTPQDPHGSDDVSSNPTNESNDECSYASQELNNHVLVDGTLRSKSYSEEMVSDSVSDKCVSPSRTSHSAVQMKNEELTASPVDKLNPSSKSQSISLNGTSVSRHPLDIRRAQTLVQETACSERCPAENLDKKCHSSTAMNCDSLELDINPVLDSEMADNTTPSKEVYMNDALETVPSGNLSGENIAKGNNENVDVSGSALNHANESYLQLGVASNEMDLDESGLNASGDCSETVLV